MAAVAALRLFVLALAITAGFARRLKQSGSNMDALAPHNAIRAKHQDTPPMNWISELETAATNLAMDYALNCGSASFFVNDTSMNIFVGVGNTAWSDIVNGWYSPIANYSYDDPGFSEDTATATQIIWANSTNLACGSASNASCTEIAGADTFYLCLYSPPGNVPDMFAANVHPLIGAPGTPPAVDMNPPPMMAPPAPTTEPEWVTLHNKARAGRRNTQPLVYDAQVEASAQDWADTLAANGCAFDHDQNSPYGENLAQGQRSWNEVLFAPTVSWVTSEEPLYDYQNPPTTGGEYGHFTQVVWASTKSVGCATSTCSNGDVTYVCRYSPPGNFEGEYANNVFPVA